MNEPNIDDLVAAGVIKPPRKRNSETVEMPQPPGSVSDEAMEKVWREERESR
jgi:hypothetical protein